MTEATRSNQPVDPITLSVIWGGFVSIAEEMGTTLRQTAFSDAVREGDDFSTAIFDRRGRMLAQGNFTPGHLGSMPHVVRSVMEYFPEEALKPGDAVLVNDSAIGSGHYSESPRSGCSPSPWRSGKGNLPSSSPRSGMAPTRRPLRVSFGPLARASPLGSAATAAACRSPLRALEQLRLSAF